MRADIELLRNCIEGLPLTGDSAKCQSVTPTATQYQLGKKEDGWQPWKGTIHQIAVCSQAIHQSDDG